MNAPTVPGSIDELLRTIVREEFERAVAQINRPKPEKEWLSMTELATELGLSLPTIRDMVERGCPHIMPSGKPRFRLAEVVEWSRQRAQGK
jgi:excisionase family DNA binding protein